MTIGQVVFSKSGRDKGCAMVIIDLDNEYVFLVDGVLRTLDKPKKKKVKHVQPTNTIVDLACAGRRGLQDADVRKLLIPFAQSHRKGGKPHCQRTM